jgi:hypothetical protein
MRIYRFLPLIAGLGLTACGSSSTQQPPPPPATDTLNVDTGSFTIPAGESLTCVYTTTTTDTEIYVGPASAQQGPGGHHVILYYTDVPKTPTNHICTDEEMLSWHMLAGAASNKEPVVSMPAGGALKVPAGKQLVIQSHYINTTGASMTVDDTMSVQLLQAADVKQFLNFFAMVDLGFSIPPQATAKHVTTCTLPNDIQAVTLLGHMHEYGQHFTFEEIDAQGNNVSTPYDTAWQPQYMTHPPLITSTLDTPTIYKAGTIFRQTCEWNNTTAQTMSFPTEMCVAYAVYFPDQGFIDCNAK